METRRRRDVARSSRDRAKLEPRLSRGLLAEPPPAHEVRRCGLAADMSTGGVPDVSCRWRARHSAGWRRSETGE